MIAPWFLLPVVVAAAFALLLAALAFSERGQAVVIDRQRRRALTEHDRVISRRWLVIGGVLAVTILSMLTVLFVVASFTPPQP
jgi:hypothetical protein